MRGLLISLKEGFVVGGILLGYLIGNLNIGQVGGWRTMYGASFFPALVLGAGMVRQLATSHPSPRFWTHDCEIIGNLPNLELPPGLQCLKEVALFVSWIAAASRMLG